MKKIKTAYLTSAIGCLVVVIGIVCYFLFAGIAKNEGTSYLFIDDDDDMDSVSVKLSEIATPIGVTAVRTMARHMGYTDKIRTGRYLLDSDMNALQFFRNLRNGHQEPLKLVMPSVRTKARLAQELGKVMMFHDSDFYGLDTAKIISMFVPNTYEVYWDTPIEKFLDRMKKESDRFWNSERKAKADKLQLNPVEVITLASIIDEETANNGEKPMIAGMYYNRLKQNMPSPAV